MLIFRSSAIFQAGGLVVVLVEIFRKNFLASIVPVIINSVLNEHHLVLDIVAFVSKGDFPRSRLGEKQRGKILASWVTRKMRTIAQFSIRDPDGADSTVTEVGGASGGSGTMRNGSVKTESIKTGSYVDAAGNFSGLSPQGRTQSPPQIQTHPFGSIPPGISEIPAEDEPLTARADSREAGSDLTPTLERPQPPMTLNTTLDYSPVALQPSPGGMSWNEGQRESISQRQLSQASSEGYGDTLRSNDSQSQHQHYGQALPHPPPATDQARGSSGLQSHPPLHTNRFALDDDDDDDDDDVRYGRGASGGGLRVANRTSLDSEDWPQEAIMHMNLGGEGR